MSTCSFCNKESVLTIHYEKTGNVNHCNDCVELAESVNRADLNQQLEEGK
jgi:hypothetical protein